MDMNIKAGSCFRLYGCFAVFDFAEWQRLPCLYFSLRLPLSFAGFYLLLSLHGGMPHYGAQAFDAARV